MASGSAWTDLLDDVAAEDGDRPSLLMVCGEPGNRAENFKLGSKPQLQGLESVKTACVPLECTHCVALCLGCRFTI
jgi:hypothetical protein